MDLLSTDIRKLYAHYLFPSLGSALVITIYSLVDTIAVGQSAGPNGAAAMAVIGPVWSMMISFGLLLGIGGAAMMSMRRGSGKEQEGRRYFSVGLLAAGIFTLCLWGFFNLVVEDMLVFFGADAEILPLAMEYVFWVRLALPVFTMATVLAAYIRNDGAPGLCMVAVVTGGLFNVVGDWLFVFPLGMGISGAGLATVLGQAIQMGILCTHFLSGKNGLHWVRPTGFFRALGEILRLGVSPFLIDFTNGLLICLFNIQIVRCLQSNDALSVYGVVCTLVALIQALYNGVGQAIQPIISSNLGAKQPERIRAALGQGVRTVLLMGVTVTVVGLLFPRQLICIFIRATESVLAVGEPVFRIYFLAFLPMGLNILCGYYFQSMLHTREGMTVSLLRGILLSGTLILLLPALLGGEMIWWTMPITEVLTLAVAAVFACRMRKNAAT